MLLCHWHAHVCIIMPAFLASTYCMVILYLRERVACHTLGGYIVEHVGSFYAIPTGAHNLNNIITIALTMQCLVVNFLIYYIMHTPQEHCSNLSNVCAYSDQHQVLSHQVSHGAPFFACSACKGCNATSKISHLHQLC